MILDSVNDLTCVTNHVVIVITVLVLHCGVEEHCRELQWTSNMQSVYGMESTCNVTGMSC